MYTLFDDLKDILVLGHRGYSEKYPENTMISFQACADNPAVDGVELDVHMCKSGEVVVAHDGNLKRCAGIDKYIEDMDWEELKDIDVGSFKGAEFGSERMPLLEDLFETFGSRFVYDIELKVEPGRRFRKMCRKVWGLICEYNLQERVMVSSFNPFALRYFNQLCMLSIPTADIFCNDLKFKILRNGWGHNISKSSYLKPEYVQVDEEFLKKHDFDLIPWTVNTEEDAEKLIKNPQIKGLIGNNPELLAKISKK